MKYNSELDVTIITYADGGVVVASASIGDDDTATYKYMCTFENEQNAIKFAQEKITEPVFFTKKKMLDLAKEFNCGMVWPGIDGIVLMGNDSPIEYVNADDLIKLAYKDISKTNKSYGCALVVNNKLAKAEDIDFNKKYYMMSNQKGHIIVNRTYSKKGKEQHWLVVSCDKKLLKEQSIEFGLSQNDCVLIDDTLSNLLSHFLPNQEFGNVFNGIVYIDNNGSVSISKREIRKILSDRGNILDELLKQNEIYLDDKYFMATDKTDVSLTVSIGENLEYIVVSQRMDTMMKAFRLERMNTKNLIFTNTMTLREILESCAESDYDGVAICIDDNPDHIIKLKVEDVYRIAHNGTSYGAEDGDDGFVNGNNEFMMTERYCMMMNGGYVISSIKSPETNEIIDVIAMADDEHTLVKGLEETGYVFGEEEPASRQTYEIFAEFRDGQLQDCDGMVCFDGEEFYIVPKEVIIDTLEQWEEITDQKSVKVELEFDSVYYTAVGKYGLLTYTQPSGAAFVVVAEDIEYLQRGVDELFGECTIRQYKDDETLMEISEKALRDGMGIVMCAHDGITFIEPKRLEQALNDNGL